MKKRTLQIIGLCIMATWILAFARAPRTTLGKPRVFVQTTTENHYELIVDGRPFLIKGVVYNPIPIGQGHDYNFWNDERKPWIVDGELMEKMGINTVRFYQPSDDPEATRQAIHDLYERNGIRTMMGHWLGFWNYPAPLYADEGFRDRIKEDVLNMVREYKDEPGILCWVLGNENNYSFSGRVNAWSSPEIDAIDDIGKQIEMRATIYYSFVNDVARAIHEIDPDHPVALGNGELKYLNIADEQCPDIDILACIIYRGKSFGNIFNNLKQEFDRPLVFIEFGCDAYNAYTAQEDQDNQAMFLKSQWEEIAKNRAHQAEGAGNCLGGTLFEWSDEWWKHNEFSPASWFEHDTESNWSNGAYYFDIKVEGNKNMNEEWFGIVSLVANESAEDALDTRVARKAYYVLREFWKTLP